ncbi:hypothetical protein CTRI78_v009762 [Colletotrichum trifolii]|uniref:ATPase AAA-type core domain-containing protein n=1 Tax=Colletotrichum trifolii TaxID=5466 RepID=A0A4R8QPW7_COLTR|nr:hypothetical protein CTRI78_v009762 [Colletotrichum trifolii]
MNGSEVPGEEAESDASSSPPPLQSKHRPKYVVNWRSELCRLLQLSETATEENILDGIEEAEEKLRDAERRQYQSVADPGPPRFQVVYAIKCGVSVSSHTNDTFYLDPPWVVQSGPFKAHLRGSGNIRNMELYLERNKSVSALVYREYQCCGYDFQGQRPSQFDHLSEADLSQFFLREYIELVSAECRAALTALSHAALTNLPHPDFDDRKPASILYPYLWWYHRRTAIEAESKLTSVLQKQYVDVVKNYIEERMGSEWAMVDSLTGRGLITTNLLRYVFFHRRFMVDMNMYKKMHPAQNENALEKASHNRGKRSHVDPSIGEIDVNMTQDDPPSDDEFLMCLPSTVKGFDMKNKEWRLLEVAFIQRVEWNDKAFEDLVIEPKTKSLIKAVVTNRVRSEEGADVIEGKGNGLFILLHGGPGTGKTLTAESVAEIAKRPLYKVTCGDLGTKAHDVEKYF